MILFAVYASIRSRMTNHIAVAVHMEALLSVYILFQFCRVRMPHPVYRIPRIWNLSLRSAFLNIENGARIKDLECEQSQPRAV